jgi:hypothetical protein
VPVPRFIILSLSVLVRPGIVVEFDNLHARVGRRTLSDGGPERAVVPNINSAASRVECAQDNLQEARHNISGPSNLELAIPPGRLISRLE